VFAVALEVGGIDAKVDGPGGAPDWVLGVWTRWVRHIGHCSTTKFLPLGEVAVAGGQSSATKSRLGPNLARNTPWRHGSVQCFGVTIALVRFPRRDRAEQTAQEARRRVGRQQEPIRPAIRGARAGSNVWQGRYDPGRAEAAGPRTERRWQCGGTAPAGRAAAIRTSAPQSHGPRWTAPANSKAAKAAADPTPRQRKTVREPRTRKVANLSCKE